MWKNTVLMFASMLLFSITLQVMSKERCPIKTNGCSVPGRLPFFYKKTFTPACDKHDVCYSCGQRFGWTQNQCDRRFERDMYRLCKKEHGSKKRWLFSFPSKYQRCKGFARLYYRAVRTFGKYYWSDPSERWCSEGCTRALGNPFKPLNI
ncbi:unnamed protein product [Porites lobata]|uniref:Conodipine-M alpha chain n=1 Tax=Porites lobata TaxID=104759 RepID=A0ABN8PZ32_9CNID|nr:unnamed protein product [Porites lobata]